MFQFNVSQKTVLLIGCLAITNITSASAGVWATVAGTVVMMIAKLWFLDRMVWLFDEMKDTNDEYRSWLR